MKLLKRGGYHAIQARAGLSILSRQACPLWIAPSLCEGRKYEIWRLYSRRFRGPDGQLDVILIGTGTEVSLCIASIRDFGRRRDQSEGR